MNTLVVVVVVVAVVAVAVGSSAGEVDVAGEHLRVCVHLRERRLVLRHPALGDLLSR